MDAVSYSHSAKQEKRIKNFIENPDSNSGIVTFPKVIKAGETVTIKSGRQAILADTIVDGDLVIEAGGDVFVPAGAGFRDLDQRIDTKLDKDFSSFTYKTTPDNTDNFAIQETGGLLKKLSFANLIAWVKSFSFGWGQTWQDVTASRSLGVTYTNNTGKPIFIMWSGTLTNYASQGLYIDSVKVSVQTQTNVDFGWGFAFIVPNGSTYSVSANSKSIWAELR